MKRRSRRLTYMYKCAYMLFAVVAWAQNAADTGQINGIVKDPDQAAVAGAQVVLTNGPATTSDANGAYTFPALRPGDYTVRVNASGFQASTSPVLKVIPGQTTKFDAVLTLAGVASSVTVSAGTSENAYHVDNVDPVGPFGNLPIL